MSKIRLRNYESLRRQSKEEPHNPPRRQVEEEPTLTTSGLCYDFLKHLQMARIEVMPKLENEREKE